MANNSNIHPSRLRLGQYITSLPQTYPNVFLAMYQALRQNLLGWLLACILTCPMPLQAQVQKPANLFDPKPHFLRIPGKIDKLPPAMAQTQAYIEACECLRPAMGAPLFNLNILLPSFLKQPQVSRLLLEEYPPLKQLEIYTLQENPWTEDEKEDIRDLFPQTLLTFQELALKDLDVAQYYHFLPNPDLGQLANHQEQAFSQDKRQWAYLKTVERDNREKEIVLLEDAVHYRTILAISTCRPGLSPECQTQFWSLSEGNWKNVSKEISLQMNQELSLEGDLFFFRFSEGVGDATLFHLNSQGKVGDKIGNARWEKGKFWLKR